MKTELGKSKEIQRDLLNIISKNPGFPQSQIVDTYLTKIEKIDDETLKKMKSWNARYTQLIYHIKKLENKGEIFHKESEGNRSLMDKKIYFEKGYK